VAQSNLFKPGQTIRLGYNPTTLVLACVCVATVRVALSVALFEQPSLVPAWTVNPLRMAALIVPILAVVYRRRGLGVFWTLWIALSAFVLVGSVFAAENGTLDILRSLGASTPLDDPLWFYVVATLPLAVVCYLSVTGFVAARVERSWQVLWRTGKPRNRWSIPLRDRGAAWAIALPLGCVAGFGPVGPDRWFGLAAIVFLVIPALHRFLADL
jgi:hypothetical protein